MKTWSLKSNSVTRQVNFNRTKLVENAKIKNSNATFWVIFKQCVPAQCAIWPQIVSKYHFLENFDNWSVLIDATLRKRHLANYRKNFLYLDKTQSQNFQVDERINCEPSKSPCWLCQILFSHERMKEIKNELCSKEFWEFQISINLNSLRWFGDRWKSRCKFLKYFCFNHENRDKGFSRFRAAHSIACAFAKTHECYCGNLSSLEIR